LKKSRRNFEMKKGTAEFLISVLMVWIDIAVILLPIALEICYRSRGQFVIGGEWGLALTIPLAQAGITALYKEAVK
jgi:hypothetical protein